MMPFISELLNEFEIENDKVDYDYLDLLKTSENAFVLCMEFIDKLKLFLVNNGFTDEDEEIQFFKHIKPRFTSQLIFYREIHNIESRKPDQSVKKSIRYFRKQRKELKRFFASNSDFIRYYNIGNTSLDKEYFLRNRFDIKNNPDMSFYEYDKSFSTSQGNKIAILIANKKINSYLENKIKTLSKSLKDSNNYQEDDFDLTWTGTKTNAIEMIYAIHGTKSINHGKVTIKQMVRAFEIVLKIDLKGYYRIFLNIKSRENAALFTDVLRDSLFDYIERSDNN
jgi:hypothetical protein